MALSKEQIQQVIGEGIQELLQDGVIPFDLSAVQAIVNKISSEADLKYGQIIKIPLDASEIINRI